MIQWRILNLPNNGRKAFGTGIQIAQKNVIPLKKKFIQKQTTAVFRLTCQSSIKRNAFSNTAKKSIPKIFSNSNLSGVHWEMVF